MAKPAEGNSLACIHTALYFHLIFKQCDSQERRQTAARALREPKPNTKLFALTTISHTLFSLQKSAICFTKCLG